MERPSQQELLAFLKTVRPALSEADWREGDPLVIMQWAIPAFVNWKARKEQGNSEMILVRRDDLDELASTCANADACMEERAAAVTPFVDLLGWNADEDEET